MWLGLSLATAFGGDEDYWQLSMKYTEEGGLVMVSADPVQPSAKTPRTPNRDGGIYEIPVGIEWLDGDGLVVSSAETILPVGTRILCSEDNPVAGLLMAENLVVLRVPGPAAGEVSQVRVSPMATFGTRDAPADTPRLNGAFTFPLGKAKSARFNPPPPAFPTTKIRNTGADGARLVIVVMGDGYLQSEITSGKYPADVTRTLAAFEGASPWDQMLKATNIYRIDVPSNQSGADRENGATGTLKDTYFDTGYFTSGIAPLLSPSATGQSRAIAAADATVGPGLWDQIIIVVNSTVYGGAGGPLTVTSVNANGPLVAVHEVGHSFPGLADEYGGSITIYNGQPVSEPNVDIIPNSPKWAAWIDSPAPPLPTPDSPTYSTTVGAFEGGRYNNLGIFRPTRNCRMRTINVPFCPVCKEQHLKAFFEIVPFTESVSPGVSGTTSVAASQAFTVLSAPVDEISYEWFIGGKRIAGVTGPTLTRTTAQLPAPSQQLTVNVRYASAMMRTGAPSDSFSWTVNNTGVSAAGTPHWWLAANSIAVSPGADKADDDGDGLDAAAEYIAGTNPRERSSVLKFSTVNIAPTGGVLEFATIPGRRYRLECATTLDDWAPVAGYGNIDGSLGSVNYVLPGNSPNSRFYRIAVWIP